MSVWPAAPPPLVALQGFRRKEQKIEDHERAPPALTFSEGLEGSARIDRMNALSSSGSRMNTELGVMGLSLRPTI